VYVIYAVSIFLPHLRHTNISDIVIEFCLPNDELQYRTFLSGKSIVLYKNLVIQFRFPCQSFQLVFNRWEFSVYNRKEILLEKCKKYFQSAGASDEISPTLAQYR